jgi:hypothetical protein
VVTAGAVRPMDAAGVVLLRGDRYDPEVLLGRRHAAAGFLPAIYVFPGGRVERADAEGTPLPLERDDFRLACSLPLGSSFHIPEV